MLLAPPGARTTSNLADLGVSEVRIMPRTLLFASLSNEVRCAMADFIWRCLEARGRSREEFVDLASHQNTLREAWAAMEITPAHQKN
jgi:hypothetical protein